MNQKQNTIKQNDHDMYFDFEEWAELARRDPAAFEARRLAWCQRLIENAPTAYQRRLSGILFQINMEKQRSSNAVDSCMRLSRMMWEKLHELREELQTMITPVQRQKAVNTTAEPLGQAVSRNCHSGAKIIPLRTARAFTSTNDH